MDKEAFDIVKENSSEKYGSYKPTFIPENKDEFEERIPVHESDDDITEEEYYWPKTDHEASFYFGYDYYMGNATADHTEGPFNYYYHLNGVNPEGVLLER